MYQRAIALALDKTLRRALVGTSDNEADSIVKRAATGTLAVMQNACEAENAQQPTLTPTTRNQRWLCDFSTAAVDAVFDSPLPQTPNSNSSATTSDVPTQILTAGHAPSLEDLWLIQSLRPLQKLSDEPLNSLIRLWCLRRPSYVVFNSLVIAAGCSTWDITPFKSSYRFFVLPIHHHVYWTLAIADTEAKEVKIYDSASPQSDDLPQVRRSNRLVAIPDGAFRAAAQRARLRHLLRRQCPPPYCRSPRAHPRAVFPHLLFSGNSVDNEEEEKRALQRAAAVDDRITKTVAFIFINIYYIVTKYRK
ncbi:hypothetical protein GTA08_BOTSDO12720 [Botryosphaeria dothidea]|uniref:Uncharacterized protein n=1 Tax=Botryosphaeria dothidea TaxID=55169 RepID=A0A8H4N5B8_9PEZI|nr:hypothetical protein GTA08_BOTSDO12720 [Botryosphaeria dothidea]